MSVIHSQSMVPTSHMMWAGVWAGIAAACWPSGTPAKKYMRKAARTGGDLPPGLPHFTKALAEAAVPCAP